MSGEFVKTSALSLIPEVRAWPAIQALRLAHDKQVKVWPPHINILYPFVPEREFEDATRRLVEILGAFGTLPKLRFSRKSRFGSTAILVPEDSSGNDALARLHAACRAALPGMPDPGHAFQPHLTIGQFKGEAECRAFLDTCPPLELEAEVELCLLARDTMQHAFRTVTRIELGAEETIPRMMPCQGHPYSFRSMTGAVRRAEGRGPADFYQADGSHVRVAFEVDKDALSGEGTAQRRRTLFVIDQSGSMRPAFGQVIAAAQYMAGEAQGESHGIDFVLYSERAFRTSIAADLMSMRASGGTCFGAAFSQIRSFVEEHPLGANLAVVFMTDGQDTRTENLPQKTQDLAEFLRTSGRQITVHAIGFTASHNRQFLQDICKMGAAEGMYRYAEAGSSDALETRFAEMFDFLDIHVNARLRIGGFEVSCSGEECGGGRVRFDALLRRDQLAAECPNGTDAIHVSVGGAEMVLEAAPVDPMFAIRRVDEMEISTQSELDKAQEALSGVQVHKAAKALRQETAEAKARAQARLDKYHELFAQGARSKVASAVGNLAAELSSLRHDATFSKARRARAMAQRATTNASGMELLEKFLQALPPVSDEDVNAIEAQKLCCSLTGETAEDVMRESHRDFFVFALMVRRPEDVIDAPSVLDMQQVLSGVYSNEGFRTAAEYALRTSGPQSSHGGFAGSVKQPLALGDDVGLFRGPDGQQMNACLPLYLNEAHFARVRVQIKPILGYFFTLDPLGYKGDQTIALFGLLGNMLCMRSNCEDFSGAWADWIVEDFTKLCRGLRPIALDYLSQGGYTGAERGDLLDDFLASPAGRSKERLPALNVVSGWAAARGAEPTPRFHTAFTEELWRRNFTALYKGQPREPIIEVLERLLYGPEQGQEDGAGDDTEDGSQNSEDKAFAQWGRLKLGSLSKKAADEVRRIYRRGPAIEGLISADATYAPRALVAYADAQEFFDSLVEAELAKIRRHNSFTAALYQERPHGVGFTGAERRLMLIQALQYVGNDAMNDALEKGRYLDTFDCLHSGEGAAGAEARVCGPLHARFETTRREKFAACIEKRNALLTARRIARTNCMDAFVGRCAVSCPTRGGLVFENLVALLASGTQVPMLASKVELLMTGKVDDAVVLSEGSSWVHCPVDTAKRFQEVIGEEEFAKMELKMRGTWGHVYRESDLPNRHGHCNSNPNSELVVSFSGFRLAIGGA